MSKYSLVNNTYKDGNFYTIDAWETNDSNEEGKVVAVVHVSGDVYFIDHLAEHDEKVKEAIKEVQDKIKGEVSNTKKSEIQKKRYGYNIVIDMDVCPRKDLGFIRYIANKYHIQDDNEGDFYCYNEEEYKQFIKELKENKFGKQIYLYRGEYPDYEWKFIEQITFQNDGTIVSY